MAGLLPDRDSGGSQWQVAFPATHYTRINPMDPDSTGLALAQAIASATGQRVVRG